MERCELTELLTAECAHCRPRREKVWAAKFAGTCATCGKLIEEGDLVQWTPDGTGVECGRH